MESVSQSSSQLISQPKNIHIISYASREFIHRIPILNSVLGRIKGITNYKIYTESDIPSEFIEKIGPYVWEARKGAGFMCWKPWIINDYLNKLKDGDNLIYIDAGCSVNLARPLAMQKLNEYLDLVNNLDTCGMLRYELPNHPESKYTNRYFWDYMCSRYPMLTSSNYYDTPQLISGIMFMRKCAWVCDLFNEAVSITLDNPELLSEKHNQSDEIHRHDQSLLSILYKVRHGDLVIPDKTYPRSLTIKERQIIPFLATRSRH